MRYIGLSILLIATMVAATAFTPGDGCKSLLINYNKKMASVTKPADNSIYFMHYSIVNYFSKNRGGGAKEIEFKITKTSDLLLYESTMMSMYIDNEDSFVVLPDQKKIIKGKTNVDLNNSENVDKAIHLQDSIARYSRLLECSEEMYEGKKCKTLRLEPSNAIQKNEHIIGLKYFFSPDGNNLYQSIMYYDQTSAVSHQKFIYHNIDFNYSKLPVKTAKEMIFASTGLLKKKYSSYELLENE